MLVSNTVTDNIVTFTFNAGEDLMKLIFNAVKLLADNYDAILNINGQIISVLCPNNMIAEIINSSELY